MSAQPLNSNETSRVVIFATSPDCGSRSQIMARFMARRLQELGVSVDVLDLREHPLPLYGSRECEKNPEIAALKAAAGRATHLVFAVPIYNWDVNAAAKNLLEVLGGPELSNKTVSILFAAGGRGSYMAPMGFINSLMLDFKAWIVPHFVQACGDDFCGDELSNVEVIKRIDKQIGAMFSRVAAPKLESALA